LAALSLTVSTMLRACPVAGSARRIRVSRISSDGATWSVAARISARLAAPSSGAFITKAISASIRGWMNRPAGTVLPDAKAMSSSSTPLSGVVMPRAACIARLVSPIFQPIRCRPAARLRAISAA
jgi:hypothetical protein